MQQCRFCKTELKHEFVNLGMQPPSNAYIKKVNDYKKENFFPLITHICDKCKLVQTVDFNACDELFTNDYAYFSSYSNTWLEHAKKYVEMISEKLSLNESSQVIEIASNDGYLLQYFNKKNIPNLGIEPCRSVAAEAISRGVKTVVEFFGEELAQKLPKADLILGNNVLAHVPDINDFISGVKILLKEDAIVTFEFPHLLNLIEKVQFDTIYHEHYSYFSLIFIKELFKAHELSVFDVEELPTHGGSLRVYGCHKGKREISKNVQNLIHKEEKLNGLEVYTNFSNKVKEVKRNVLKLLIEIKDNKKSIISYGAAAKGNTLFNYCGIGKDFIDYSVDLTPYKQGKLLPGVHIEIKPPEQIEITKPDYIFITPWNFKDEIIKKLEYTRSWGAKFIIAIPKVEVL